MIMKESIGRQVRLLYTDCTVPGPYSIARTKNNMTEFQDNTYRGYSAKRCLIRLSIFTNAFLFFRALRSEKEKTDEQKCPAVLDNFSLNKMFIIRQSFPSNITDSRF